MALRPPSQQSNHQILTWEPDIVQLVGRNGQTTCLLTRTNSGGLHLTPHLCEHNTVFRDMDPQIAEMNSAVTNQPNRLTPGEYVRMLQQLPVLNARKSDLSGRLITLWEPEAGYVLPLFRDSRRTQYVLMTGPRFTAPEDWDKDLPGSYEGPHRAPPEFGDDFTHPTICELLYPTWVVESGAADRLPHFVYQLGRLGYCTERDQREGGGGHVNLSTLIVAMDVCNPRKPLWLIHDGWTDEEFKIPVAPNLDDNRINFPGHTRFFDIALLLGDIMKWDELSWDNAMRSVNAASYTSRANPIFSTAWHKRIFQEVQRGWEV
ncbi:hypothetical protein B0H63DRAFT_565078 [Podospora didyma]|uniref:Uncharacterized protein n=1 Tax=Podospora didyma TaxID=330526 RepID=A0AAE0K1K0_9PEZI|nr:hypothetical protein B0H63DRAFT_565078 [Podospora didyma]